MRMTTYTRRMPSASFNSHLEMNVVVDLMNVNLLRRGGALCTRPGARRLFLQSDARGRCEMAGRCSACHR